MVYSLGGKYAAFVIQLAVAMVLARLLSPEETGVFSLAVAAIAFGHLVREFGVSDYVITQRDITRLQLRSAFTATLLIAWAVAAVFWLLAWPMAAFYDAPGVKSVMHLLCINFMLLPFGSVASAVLSKDLQFGRLALYNTLIAAVGGVTTVVSAWLGFSFLSMAIGAVASNVCTIAMFALVEPRLVALKPSVVHLREVLRFGGTLTTARFVEQLGNRSSDFIISATLGLHATGLYSKASTLIGSFHEFFNSAIARVATPALARAVQQREDLQAPYLRATTLVAATLWVFFPVLGVYAHELILVMFGAQWLECVPVVQLAAAGSLLHGPFILSGSMLTARQAVRQQLRIQVWSTPVMILAIAVGAQHSLVAVMGLVVVASCVKLLFIDHAMRSACDMGVEKVLPRLAGSAAIGAAALGAGLLSRWALMQSGWPPLLVLAVGVAVMLATAGCAARLLQHPLWLEMAALLQRLKR